MSEARADGTSLPPGVAQSVLWGGAARRLTDALRLAAAPTFAVMALLAGLPGDSGAADILCLTAGRSAPFSGMVLMYLLMSVFHLPPWLQLLVCQGNGLHR